MRIRFAIDSGTRELGSNEAFAIAREFAPMLAGATIAYKKIDSLLRGPWVAEVDACLQAGCWDACIVAPAFVYQGRRTRAGQHYAMASDGSWSAVGTNIIQQDRERGWTRAQATLPPSFSLGSACSTPRPTKISIASCGSAAVTAGAVLWCGSGGLASALARGTDVACPGP